MLLLTPGLCKPVSYLLATAGAGAIVADTSLGEHADTLVKVLGVLALVAAFWIIDWKRRQDTFRSHAADKLEQQALTIVGLQRDATHTAQDIEVLRRDAVRAGAWRSWAGVTLTLLAAERGVKIPPLPRPHDSGEYPNPTIEGA